MANRQRGEISAIIGGRQRTMCLTLGALAELEDTYGDEDLIALAERFEQGRISATDAIRIIGAGLRGAGEEVTSQDVAAMAIDGGAPGYIALVAELLQATFPPASGDDGG
jgi:hypothetical protein